MKVLGIGQSRMNWPCSPGQIHTEIWDVWKPVEVGLLEPSE